MKKIFIYLEHEEEQILAEAENLQNALTHLRYEGKVSRGKNIKAAKAAVNTLGRYVERHRVFHERIIFPFLTVHVPKHEALIHFLCMDHADMRSTWRKLSGALILLSKRKDTEAAAGRIRDLGIYLVSLLRHHIGLEKKSIMSALKNELRGRERTKIKVEVHKWLGRSGTRAANP